MSILLLKKLTIPPMIKSQKTNHSNNAAITINIITVKIIPFIWLYKKPLLIFKLKALFKEFNNALTPLEDVHKAVKIPSDNTPVLF